MTYCRLRLPESTELVAEFVAMPSCVANVLLPTSWMTRLSAVDPDVSVTSMPVPDESIAAVRSSFWPPVVVALLIALITWSSDWAPVRSIVAVCPVRSCSWISPVWVIPCPPFRLLEQHRVDSGQQRLSGDRVAAGGDVEAEGLHGRCAVFVGDRQRAAAAAIIGQLDPAVDQRGDEVSVVPGGVIDVVEDVSDGGGAV